MRLPKQSPVTIILLTEDERNVLTQALIDYQEGVEDNCEDEDLAAFLITQVDSISEKLTL